MKITRKFTKDGQDPFATVEWVTRSSRITNPDGSVVFEMKDALVPSTWSQLATDIMVSKYFRKAGVPQPDGTTGPEKSAQQVIHRLAGCWRHWGETHGYFDSKADAQAFYDELAYMMVHQMAAPNSPQWFNTGLNWAYGINGPAQGHWVVDPKSGEPELAADAYTHPQPHACFIQSVDDDLVSEGGIMDLWVREARLFKYGSGTGTNFSHLRAEGEKLSGGGRSSGLMSWLRIGDRAASAIKSGGTTRRAAKMVCLDMDHPDIEDFINWKVREEIKVRAMVEGLRLLKKNDAEIARACDCLKLTLDYDFNGEAYATVSGQNSNNSVRVPDAFFKAVDDDAEWTTYWRTRHAPAKTLRARGLWDQVCEAAWRCADPGVQFDTTINAWHTCPGAGRINASNPCSEYMFLDNTACNLASLNVLKFYNPATRAFDVERYEHACDLWTVVLEISVLMAAFPSRPIAELSYRYRTLGLGYANLGAMLMQAGIAYDSDEARAVCAMLSAVMTGRSYRRSALLAAEHGPFAGFAADRDNMLRVIRNHRHAAKGEPRESVAYEDLTIRPVPIDHAIVKAGRVALSNADALLGRSVAVWDEALDLGERHGYRNAQVTVIAPTGTIGLLMDCDTTGVEPDFALVKFKKLAGGGYFKIVNESVAPALVAMGYTKDQIAEIMTYILGRLRLDAPLPKGVKGAGKGETLAEWLHAKGVSIEALKAIEASLPGVFEIGFAFAAWSVGDETLNALGINPEKAKADPTFNLLKALGLTHAQIDELNTVVCGTQTIEGAPHVKPQHLPVFDCANTCGKLGTRFIAPEGHIRMMAAAQPFISGAISKTINLPNSATVGDIARCYRLSWELGLKANALYRDGCKLSQPLSSTSDQEKSKDGGTEAPAVGPTTLGPVAQDAPTSSPQAAAATLADAASSGAVVPDGTLQGLPPKPHRRRLPDTRRSITHKFNVAGHEGYLTVGLYDDGRPGELFITMSKEGSTMGGLMDAIGTATSVSLQYGVPVESLVNKFSHQRFEPAGWTENPDIPMAKSLVDYIFRWMGMQFVEGYREQYAPKRSSDIAQDRATDRLDLHADRAQAAAPRLDVTIVEPAASRATPGEKPGQDGPSGGGGGGVVGAVRTHVHVRETEIDVIAVRAKPGSVLSETLKEAQGDAPACDVCGTITVRNGSCYKCLNCGASMGCS
ncbi:MAG: adenosylcobalamin-dependent ribonucleoside-diphosphate reductase [Phycisphaeraceae bacterium]|nr:MAG: adenosylcobalamin-dependent ribonucleoside-diphosphate reductase [Phycisphaeraceae bacterium]